MSTTDISKRPLADLLEDLKSEDYVSSLNTNELLQLKTRLKPMSNTVAVPTKYTCISLVHLDDKYNRKLATTALSGFLFTKCKEHKLEAGEIAVDMSDAKKFEKFHVDAKAAAEVARTELEQKNQFSEYDIVVRKKLISRAEVLSEQYIIYKFLSNVFKFDVDSHIRESHCVNPLDPRRKKPVAPPAETFYFLDNYINSMYEELRVAVHDIWGLTPDLESAVNVFGEFDTLEEATAFVDSHKSDLTSELITVTNGIWNLDGPFKNNQDKIDFYNKNTDIIRNIMEQNTKDQELGADIMRKRVVLEKTKNIQEYGEDDEEFTKFRADHPSDSAGIHADTDLKERAKQIRARLQNDYNADIQGTQDRNVEKVASALEVDIININAKTNETTKSKIYTQSDDIKKDGFKAILAPSDTK